MAKLHTMESIVLRLLEEDPLARDDDYYLMCLVCEELNPDLLYTPFAKVMIQHKEQGLPSWETVTRCRRKIQQKRPDLVSSEIAEKRRKEEEQYREYARHG